MQVRLGQNVPQGPLRDLEIAGGFGDGQQKMGRREKDGQTGKLSQTRLSERVLSIRVCLGGPGLKDGGLAGQPGGRKPFPVLGLVLFGHCISYQ